VPQKITDFLGSAVPFRYCMIDQMAWRRAKRKWHRTPSPSRLASQRNVAKSKRQQQKRMAASAWRSETKIGVGAASAWRKSIAASAAASARRRDNLKSMAKSDISASASVGGKVKAEETAYWAT